MSSFGVQPRARDWQPFTDGRYGWRSTDGHEIEHVRSDGTLVIPGFYLDGDILLAGTTRDTVIESANNALKESA